MYSVAGIKPRPHHFKKKDMINYNAFFYGAKFGQGKNVILPQIMNLLIN